MAVLKIQRVAAAGAEIHRRNQMLRYLVRAPGCQVDLVHIGELAPEHGVVLVRDAIQRERASAVFRQPHLFLHVGGERHQAAAAGDVPRRQRYCDRDRVSRSASAR